MNDATERLATAANERLANVDPAKRHDALVEVNPADVLDALSTPTTPAEVESIRVALVKGSLDSNGRPVAVRADQLLRVLIGN